MYALGAFYPKCRMDNSIIPVAREQWTEADLSFVHDREDAGLGRNVEIDAPPGN